MMTLEIRQKMTSEWWIALLSNKHPHAFEHIILISRLKKPYTLRVSKTALREAFGNCSGLRLLHRQFGTYVEATSDDQRNFTLNDDIVQQLGLIPGCDVCVTQQIETGTCMLKHFDSLMADSEVPGSVVIDTFSPKAVKRTQYTQTDLAAIDNTAIHNLVARMGQFQYDPLVPLMQSDGRVGYLTRRLVKYKRMLEEQAFIEQSTVDILRNQRLNGSWDDNLITTASCVIRLVEFGKTINEPAIAKATDWLLSSPELVDLPGLFAATADIAKDFNLLKPEGHAKSQIYDKMRRTSKYQHIKDTYSLNADILPGVCELAVTSASAVVLQVLLMLGFAEYPRVNRAINTLLSLWLNRWCGCGYFKPGVVIRVSNDKPDFESRFDLHTLKSWLHNSSADWFAEGKRNHMTAPRSESWQIGDHKVLVEHQANSGDYCTFGVHHALSWHPLYPGSNLSTAACLEYARRQTALGQWGPPRSMVLMNLARLSHPLAAFLTARTIPQLIREQENSGLWPEGAVGSFRILQALEHFGFLSQLVRK